MNNIKIFVCTHKKYDEFGDKEIYKPLLCGATVNSANSGGSGYILDNEGDNISYKNPYYNELTGLYWIWKNSNYEFCGLIHYRRYFIKNMFSSKILEKEDIEKYLNEYDIIVEKPLGFNDGSVGEFHKNTVNINKCWEYFPFIRDTISNKFPDYLNSFDSYMENNKFYPHTLFVTRKEIIDNYCEFLFTILQDLEDIIGLNPYNDKLPQKRVFSFLGEILWGIWLNGTKLKIKECHIYRMEARNNVMSIIDENFCDRRISKVYGDIVKWFKK